MLSKYINVLNTLNKTSKLSKFNIQKQNVIEQTLRTFSTSRPLENIQIDVTPKEAMLDDPPRISVQGLKEKQKITLWNTFIDEAGLEFSSHAHYIADEKGVVDVCNDVSYGGKYEGIFPEGLITALRTAPPTYKEKHKLKWARMIRRDVKKPLEYNLKVVDGHQSEGELYSNSHEKQMGETNFIRHVMGKGVRRFEIEEGRIRAVLFLPPGQGPFPIIVDIQGVEPGTNEARASLFASYGYATLALPYFNYKDLPKEIQNLDLNYFLETIDYLKNNPDIISDRIGVIGTSKGGEIGLTLCRFVKNIKACITVNSYHFSVDVDYYLDGKLFLKKYNPNPKNAILQIKDEIFYSYPHDLTYDLEYDRMLPIEEVHDDCYYLLTSGDDDGPHSFKSGVTLKRRMQKLKPDTTVSIMVFPGAGHLIDPPFHPHIDSVWNSTILIRKEDGTRYKGLPHYYGGNPYDHCQAAKNLWQRALLVYHKKLIEEAGLPANTTRFRTPY